MCLSMSTNNVYNIEHDGMIDLIIDILNTLSKYIANPSKETLDTLKSILMEIYKNIKKKLPDNPAEDFVSFLQIISEWIDKKFIDIKKPIYANHNFQIPKLSNNLNNALKQLEKSFDIFIPLVPKSCTIVIKKIIGIILKIITECVTLIVIYKYILTYNLSKLNSPEKYNFKDMQLNAVSHTIAYCLIPKLETFDNKQFAHLKPYVKKISLRYDAKEYDSALVAISSTIEGLLNVYAEKYFNRKNQIMPIGTKLKKLFEMQHIKPIIDDYMLTAFRNIYDHRSYNVHANKINLIDKNIVTLSLYILAIVNASVRYLIDITE